MRVTQEELARYRSEVDAAAELARAYIGQAIEQFRMDEPRGGVAEEREFTISLLRTALPNFTEAAATVSCDFFDELREAQGWPADIESEMHDMTDYQVVSEKVHYYAKYLAAGDAERFKREVVDVTGFLVKRSAFMSMVANCKGQEMKWARVPTGFETCPFCFMLASRGFDYGSKRSALVSRRTDESFHRHCDCIAVPGFEDDDGNPRVKIDGYDPQVMYENWRKCAETIGRDPMDSSKEAMKAIMEEVATRDWHWLYTGEPPKYHILMGAEPSDDEKNTANRLSASGYRSVFRPTRSRESKRTSDVFFDNGLNQTPWEYKNPKGDGSQTISHQFEEAAGQSRNIVIDSHYLGESWTDSRLIEEVRQKLNRKKGFKVSKGQYKGEIWFFEQIIVILKDKTTVKIRRG